MPTQKYKNLHRYEHPNHARLFTFSTYKRTPLLTRGPIAGMLLEATSRACDQQQWDVLAFIVMPDHMHLLARPRRDQPDASRLLFAIKRPVSFHVKLLIQGSAPALLDRLIVTEGRSRTFRLWQAGGGHDRNLWNHEAINNSIEYLHTNPVRKGLCETPEEWEWSSFSQWMTPEKPVPVGFPVIDRYRAR